MEKAGIIKPGRPVVSNVAAPDARTVIEAISRERGSPIRQWGVEFDYAYEPARVSSLGSELIPELVQVKTSRRVWPTMQLGLLGEHQAANAAGVVAAVEELREQGWQISDSAVESGLAEVRWPARMEVLGYRPLVVLDCAHNVASAEALVKTLESCFPPAKRTLIFAGSSDKDIPGMFKVLAPCFQRFVLTRYSNNPRSVPPEKLAEWLRACWTGSCGVCDTSSEAWRLVRDSAGPNDLICIAGSVFLAGEMREKLVTELNPLPSS
jgi:dihydrofolate synthase/folylpolyglutamate synthase